MIRLLTFLLVIDLSFSKSFILTIDDAPNTYTIPIANILINQKVQAVWFISGRYYYKFNREIKFLIDNRFVLGNHTVSHDYNKLKTASIWYVREKELKPINEYLNKVFKYKIRLFRPPYGVMMAPLTIAVQDLNMEVVSWTIILDDFKKSIKNFDYMERNRDVEIILVHCTKDTLSNIMNIIKEVKKYGKFINIKE